MTPGRLWWLWQRDWARGWRAAYHDYFTLGKILRWRTPAHFPVAPPVAVHVFTGAETWLLAAWMLASFTHFTTLRWEIFIHDDGTLPPEARASFPRLFPRAQIIGRKEADQALDAALAAFPRCQALRRENVLAPKLFDPPHFTSGTKLLLLDSDILFFRRPAELMEWADSGEGCWFNRDVSEASLVSAEEAREKLGVTLWPQVNAGLSATERGVVDPAFCERVLGETDILGGHFWRIEQTLLALCASRQNRGGLLPGTYEVSLGKSAAPDVIARHYVGAVRSRFFAEGLPRLERELFTPSVA